MRSLVFAYLLILFAGFITAHAALSAELGASASSKQQEISYQDNR